MRTILTTILPSRHSRRPALLGLLCASSCIPGAGAARNDAAAAATTAERQAIAEFVTYLDDVRREAGCVRRLEWDDDVAAVAAAHAADMQSGGYYSHFDALGRDVLERLRMARIPVDGAAENLALGRMTGHAALQHWMDSPGHRENMINCAFSRHGVAVVGEHWVHVLIRPRGIPVRHRR